MTGLQLKSSASLRQRLMRYWPAYLLPIPVVAWYVVFCYLPMGGLVIAFKRFSAIRGIGASPWVGWENFERLFASAAFLQSVKNTIIIMTSNAGAGRIVSPKHLGFGTGEDENADYQKMKESVMEEVKRIFKPEFINRIDEILVFHTLTKENIEQIVRILLRGLNKRLQEQMSMELIVSDAAVAHLAESGFDKTYGARPVRRSIQTEVEDELADRMLDGEFAAGDKIYVDCSQKKLTFSKR